MAKGTTRGAQTATRIFYATNRDHLDGGFAMDASPGQERRLQLGSVEVETLGKPEATEARRDLLALPDKSGDDDFTDPANGRCATLLDAWLAEAAQPKSVALLFVHGFSNSFNRAMQCAAQLVEFYAAEDLQLVPLAFSWPSDGKVISPDMGGNLVDGTLRQYKRDQDDATAAGPALARLLAEIRRARTRQAAAVAKPPPLCLLAHSMGNHALASGLLSLDNGLMTASMRGLFDDAFLAAADVPSGAFAPGQSLRLVAALATRATVGISFDNTLALGSQIANGNRRLGHFGPDDLAMVPDGIEVVDYFPGLDIGTRDRVLATGGTEFDVVQHQWYRNDFAARADIALLLAGKKPKRRKKLPAGQQTEANRTRHAFLG